MPTWCFWVLLSVWEDRGTPVPQLSRLGLGPPEAYGEAGVQGPDVVPVLGRDKESLARMENAGLKRSCLELGELRQVRFFHVHLDRTEVPLVAVVYLFQYLTSSYQLKRT